MLYSNKEIKSIGFDHQTAMQRYLYKYTCQKKDFHRLKAHEKDYVFSWMETIYTPKGDKAFNLYEETEASEYLFYKIFLTYKEGIDSFDGQFDGPNGKISREQVLKDKEFYNKYYHKWKSAIETHKGPYLSIIAPMLYIKLKEIKKIFKTEHELLLMEKYCYSIFFYIYYQTKLYFDENNKKFIAFNIREYSFVGNVYTYCHILSRHYFPIINEKLDVSMNDNNTIINPKNLLEDLKAIINKYYTICNSINEKTETLLFKIDQKKYILWIKYKQLDELSKAMGFEIRSFYKCERERDLSLFNNTIDIKIEDNLICSIPR